MSKADDKRKCVTVSMLPRIQKYVKKRAKENQRSLSAEVELRLVETIAREQAREQHWGKGK